MYIFTVVLLYTYMDMFTAHLLYYACLKLMSESAWTQIGWSCWNPESFVPLIVELELKINQNNCANIAEELSYLLFGNEGTTLFNSCNMVSCLCI